MKTSGRGCGSMAYGAVYAELSTSPFGIHISNFVICPVWDLSGLKLSAQGMNIIPRIVDGKQDETPDGKPIFDVFDIVGKNHYPYKADFYEEARLFGISRRWPKNTPINQLIPGVSRHYLCSMNGVLEEIDHAASAVNAQFSNPKQPQCLTGAHTRQSWDYGFGATCSAFWWSEMTANDCFKQGDAWYRNRPSLQYQCFPSDEQNKFHIGAFMWMPVNRFVVTKNQDGTVDPELEEIYSQFQQAGFDPRIVDIDEEE